METEDVATLAAALLQLKEQENEARDARVVMEERVIAALDFKKPEGSETYEAGRFKITCRRPINRSVDAEAWETVKAGLDSDGLATVENLMRTKYELNLPTAREIEQQSAALWRKIALCISSKPGKVAVEVKDGAP